MASTTITVKYTMAGTSGIVKSQPFKQNAKFDELSRWKYVDKLNKLSSFTFAIPNDKHHEANALFERDVFIPFLKPFHGVITGRSKNNDNITLQAHEKAWHLTRRIFRFDGEEQITYTDKDWYDSNWKFRRAIHINGDFLEDSLENFPFQFHNRHTPDDPHSIVHAESDGKDFVVTLPDGVTPIPHEIEYWDDTDEEEIIRAKPPKIKDSNSIVAYLYYGNASAVDSQDAASVWSNRYGVVYHFQEDPTATNYVDSTGNGNTGTPTSVTGGGGHHGNAPQFDGVDSKIECGSDSSIDDIFAAPDVDNEGGKLECWFFANSSGESSAGILATKVKWTIEITDVSGGKFRLKFTRDFDSTDGVWQTDRIFDFNTEYKFSIEYDETDVTHDPIFYSNGEVITTNEVTTPIGSAVSDAGDNLTLGNNTGQTATWDGYIEEFRLHTTMRDTNWERSDYRNEVMDTNEPPIFGHFDFQEQYLRPADEIAQQILDSANTDMPSGITWQLDVDFPTTQIGLKIKEKNHFEALHALGEALGLDIWFDNKEFTVHAGTKGKTLNEELDIIISSEPTQDTESFANIIQVIGAKDNLGIAITKDTSSDTNLRYNYERIIKDRNIGTQEQADAIADDLLTELQDLTPHITGQVPHSQFTRLNLAAGDTVLISQPKKGLNGRFRVVGIEASPDVVKLEIEGQGKSAIRTRDLGLGDIIDALIRQFNGQE